MILTISLNFYASGDNQQWTLGLGLDPSTTAQIRNFTQNQVSAQQKFSQISATLNVLALHEKNVYGWGANIDGSLSSPDKSLQKPVKLQFFEDNEIIPVQVASSSYFSLVLDDKGQIYSSGRNSNGQLGRATFSENDSTPGLVNQRNLRQGEKVTSVKIFQEASFALTNQGNLYIWGFLFYEQKIPTLFSDKKVEQIYGDFNGIWIVDDKKDLYALGNNEHGQLCNPLLNSEQNEFVFTGFNDIKKVATSSKHSIILKNGVASGCGKGDLGQFGNKSIEMTYEPFQLTNELGKVIDVVCTNQGTMVLSDKGLFAAGNNTYGELSLKDSEIPHYIFEKVIFEGNTSNIRQIYSSLKSVYIEMNEEKPNKLSGGAIAGIVIGSIAGVAIICVAAFYFAKHCKNEQNKKEVINQEQEKLNIDENSQ